MSRNIGPRNKTIQTFQKDNFADDNLEKIQTNVQQFISALTYIPILRGRLIDDIFIDSAIDTRIEHKLNRIPKGYLITKMDSPAIVTHAGFDKSFLLLSASSSTTIGIWVF
jgi:hypothetical protein